LALLDVEDDRAILSVCAANSFGNSIHRLALLGTVGCLKCVSHTLTLGAVEMPVILEFVRERIGLLNRPRRLNEITNSQTTSWTRNVFAFPF
jgi:hypothetical protein